MIVADLDAGDLRRRLAGPGLRLRVGPVVAEIRSGFNAIANSIALLYTRHEIVGGDDFADFHVAVEPSPGLRRWVRPQALFRFEGNRPFKPLAAAQAFPLLEWGLNWCVSAHCHQYLIIHAAVVERAGRALVLPAPPGSGKSTLCAGLVARGWRLLSDELALIDIATRHVVPIPRPISLKNEAIEVVARFWPEAQMSDVVDDTVKGSVAHVRPPGDSVQSSPLSAPAGWIVMPRFVAHHAPTLESLGKSAAFMQLVESSFNYSMHGRTGFEVLADVVATSHCFRFTYGGALDDAVRRFDALADVT